jgi:filamentous hemagglutinin family protein
MNRNRYRLVFNTTSGMMVPVAETVRRQGKSGGGKAAGGLALAGMLLASPAWAEGPVGCSAMNTCGPSSIAALSAAGNVAMYNNADKTRTYIDQVGSTALADFRSFNTSAGHTVQVAQVDQLGGSYVPGANFNFVGRIWDGNPTVFAGNLVQVAGQKANVTLINTDGIAFMGGSQVNLNSFTASSLDIKDSYIFGALLNNDSNPQFEGTGGFIKVFEGARITAGSQGRVMLLAPTVVNKGTVEAPDGQVIVAAGTRVYLSAAGNTDKNVRGLLVEVDSPDGLADFDTANTTVKDGMLDGEAVDLTDASEDKLGHVTNFGELTTPRGNVTMIGYAVNQNGIARATTSVVANGSVYLLAKDEAVSKTEATRGGRVTMGAGSLTEVLPDTADATGALDGDTGQGLAQRSQVLVVGQTINMNSGATIHAPSADVNLIALDNPGQLNTTNDPFNSIGAPVSGQAKVHIASGAVIDVAGLQNVQVSAARNGVEVELRGDELKDSPVNRDGPLRGKKVYLDVAQALANANAGKSTLIAKDSLESYQAKLERTVAERSTTGGTVNVKSQGEAALDSGSAIKLSGGSVQYTAANVRSDKLSANGKLVDLADADAETRYDAVATKIKIVDERWNTTEEIDLGYRYDPGYLEGKDAGALNVIGMKAVQLQSGIEGKTVTGERQREAGIQPKGATLKLGSGSVANDYKLNQNVVIGATTLAEVNTLALDAALFGKDKIANLEVFSNQAAEVREALRLPQGGSVAITAKGVAVNADVEAGAGTISFNARSNSVDVATVPLDVTVADGVTLSALGTWANDLPTASGRSGEAALVNGGKVTLSAAEDVTLGAGSLIDVTGGGRVKPDGKLKNGNGGNVTLEAGAGASAAGSHSARVTLGGEVRGQALGQGGTLSINTAKIQVGGTPDPAALNLDAGFVARGGFANFNLTGRDGVTVADGVNLTPRVESLELQPGYKLLPTGGRIESVARKLVRDDRIRQAANLTLSADGTDFGVVKIGNNANIQGDDRASLAFKAGKRIEIQGQVATAGGSISANLSRDTNLDYDPANTIWLGPQALLDASGAARTYLDSKGRRVGEVLDGGTVALNAVSGFVVTEAGSLIRTNGVAPVRLDVLNEAGSLGRMVGSDAGTLRIAAREGALLDGSLQAQAGSRTERGGRFEFTLGNNVAPQGTGYPTETRIVSLAPVTAVQAGGLAPSAAVPSSFNGQAKLGANALEAAGFESIALKSRDTIRLEDGLDFGGARSVPLREIQLDAPRLETAGGDAALTAHTIRIGNDDVERQDAGGTPTPGTGVLRADAQLLELTGKQTFAGMARAELTGAQEVRLSGVSTSATPRPTGALTAAADLAIHGALVAPATYAQYTLDATGHRIEFSRTAQAPVQPLSALGSLTVKAQDIVQGGNLWAPFGQIDLQASNSLVFRDGSLTSVSAAPGSLTPFGKVENGRTWIVDADGTEIEIAELPEKSIRTQATRIDMQAGATLDLAGGGDLQAYEFTVGPGGSRDILADKNTYAILPGYTGGFAPGDVQEGFDRASGEAVYLSGVPGLADGVYTMLPAHYALLPGAYAVRLDTGIQDVMPGRAYSRQDGVRIAAGYVTDSRANAPKDANWQGVEVLTHEQVRARSEFTLSKASDFFGAGTRPQDAGLLAIHTTGSGSDSLRLDATYKLAAGQGGRGAAVDISATRLAVVSGAPAGIDPDAAQIDADTLNALGAESLLLGGTRATQNGVTTFTVNADAVTLANDADHALQAGEVMLAATDTLTLKAGSAIGAQGGAGDAGTYQTAGNGAFVRAASTSASFTRTGNPDRSQGTLIGEAGSTISAADSITLDATRENAYQGTTHFRKDGQAVAGNLGVGAARVNFGATPTGAEGLTFTQAELDALDLKGLTLTSYSTFDLYGDVSVGRLDGNGKPVLQNLTLQGAGLAGVANAGQTAQLNAHNLTLANSAASGFTPGGALGDGTLAVTADTLTLGAGSKAIQGYSAVTVEANELVGSGTGTMEVAAPVTLNVARIRGEAGANQTFDSTGALNVAQRTADRVLAPVNALGAQWALKGTAVDFDSRATLPSGTFTLTATGGDVNLGANARVDVAGREVEFFDVKKPSWGGTAEFASETGNVNFARGSNVDVSAAAGGDAGTLIVRAANGTFTLADGSVSGAAPTDTDGQRGEGARAEIDTGTLADFSTLNATLNTGGFDGARTLRVRTGNVNIAAGDTIKAKTIRVAADSGTLDVAGVLDASGGDAGRIELFAENDVNVHATAKLKAVSSGTNEDGGDVEIGSTAGTLDLAAGSTIDVAGGSGGQGGAVSLRAQRTGSDVAVSALDSAITGARSVAVEAVKVYDNISMLTATGGNGTTLSLATINADNTDFAANHAAIRARLGKADDADFHLLNGVEVRSAGDLTLGSDWNLAGNRAGGEAGVLTLRAAGNLKLDNNLSDGFNVATPLSGTAPATLLADDSWSYRLVGGADGTAADPLAVVKDAGDITLKAGKLVRTGTGDIRLASGRDIRLADNKAVIYSAGRAADAVSGFTNPANAQFSQGGGDVSLAALGNITGAPSAQLYSNWLFRQGKLNGDGSYATQPAWWVRFDQFQQGVAALGGGDVSIKVGGRLENLSASTPTQARMAAASSDVASLVKTGGGDVRIETGGDLAGGQYYADNGKLVIRSGSKLGSGQNVGIKPLYTILALGDAQAKVQARSDINLHALINPHLVVQSSGAGANVNVNNASSPLWSVFSTYGENSAASLASLAGAVNFHNAPGGSGTLASMTSAVGAYKTPLNFAISSANYNAARAFAVLPSSLRMTAFQGNVLFGGTTGVMRPAAKGGLDLLAADSVSLPAVLSMSDMEPMPDAVRPAGNTNAFSPTTLTAHATQPVHTGDTEPVRVYALAGDVTGAANKLNLNVPKSIRVKAGRDVRDLGISAQHVNAADISQVEAGRDVVFSSLGSRSSNAYIWVAGPGRLDVTAGRNVDLGTSAGIVSRGNLDNVALPSGGADIQVTAGVGPNGVDYAGAVDRLLAALQAGSPDDSTLWLARWLTGDDSLTAANAESAVQSVAALDTDGKRTRVRELVYTALRTTGRDSLDKASPYAADYARGYAALELVFPGMGEKDADGSFKNYQGEINLFASRILTERGGNIEFMTPGGDVVVGLSNTPAVLLATQVPGSGIGLTDSGVLGMATVADGSIRGFAREDVLVNQSRILTVGGGDVLLWSSEGDIDAGKGKKTAATVPPPLTLVDAQGNITQVLQGAASGSGIGALTPAGGTAGDVDLIAPKGTINAGDAGIRAGNLSIAGLVVLGADNISVSGSSAGTPVADTSAVTAATSGASNANGGVANATTALSQGLSDAARAAETLKQAFRPTFITAEVIGHGE